MHSSPDHRAPPVRTQVTCSKCGAQTTVPFAPTPGRPVYCRECFGAQPARPGGPPPSASGPRGPPPSGGGRGPGGYGESRGGGYGRPQGRAPSAQNVRQRMMAQGRKGHFMHDAKVVLTRLEGGMDEQHVRAFLEGLFARGARTNVEAAQIFLDEKVADNTITPQQRDELGRLVERYSFWR